MTTLHLGVVDLPYRHTGPGYRGRGKKRRPAKSIGSRSTFEVAQILERRYNVMESFFSMHSDEIVQALVDSFEGATELVLLTGFVPPADPSASAMEKVRIMFQKFLDDEELAGANGVPTQAALMGVSHRFAHPYAKGRGRRPSFIDTGLYQSSFRAWID